ncbi:bifunctional enoyl-CoA hydratase/phosphate acetyltransferase [bacterium]|nr:bifunctional enoyl-CoA hydratase/phosphate acetyltransferase [bacterium]
MKKLEDLVSEVQGGTAVTVAVAAGQDPDTISAIAHAVEQNVVKAILVGDETEIKKVAEEEKIDIGLFDIIHEPDPREAAKKAVAMIHDGKADMVMKGLVKTPDYLKAILNKDAGLMESGSLLCHMAVTELPAYPKLLICSDAAIMPCPDLEQKIQMLNSAIGIAHALGIETPKAALIAAAETVSPKMQSTMDAAVIASMSQRKQIKGGIVDGPLALDVALSKKKCEIKGLESPVNGEADILIFSNIEAANTFYKSATLLSSGKTAAIVAGTKAPVILTSRADDEITKYYSIALGAIMAQKQKK